MFIYYLYRNILFADVIKFKAFRLSVGQTNLLNVVLEFVGYWSNFDISAPLSVY